MEANNYKAYFVINVAEEFYRNKYQDVLRDLKAMPEVKSIERISGTCDLLINVEAPIRVIFTANKVLVKAWAKRLHVLNIEPFHPDECRGLTNEELSRVKGTIPVASR